MKYVGRFTERDCRKSGFRSLLTSAKIGRLWTPLPLFRRILSLQLVFCLGLIVALSVVCAGPHLVVRLAAARSRVPVGYVMQVCVWRIRGKTTVLLYSPFISSLVPPGSARCARVPWLPFVPHWAHVWEFPA